MNTRPGSGSFSASNTADPKSLSIPAAPRPPCRNGLCEVFHGTLPAHPGRRDFLKRLGWVTAAGSGAIVPAVAQASEHASGHATGPTDPMGVLVDLTACVGCRLCEHACKKANDIDPGPLESYDDTSVFNTHRRPAPEAFTVVNAFPNSADSDKPVYAKINCMHCNNAACVSACIVGALRKRENGAVTYDYWKCIGCRYCMVACPFQLPAYSYDHVLTPAVRKCQFCNHRTEAGKLPGCVEACPRQAIIYGKRNKLIEVAHDRIRANPGKYEDHVYGEHEVGGTSWMYLSPIPYAEAGFLPLGTDAPPVLTEAIQHGVFKYWIAPVTWYSFLLGAYWLTGRKHRVAHAAVGHAPDAHAHEAAGPASVVHDLIAARTARHAQAAMTAGGSADDTSAGGVALAVGLESEAIPMTVAGRLPISPPAPVSHSGSNGHGRIAHAHPEPAPVDHKLLTPGVWLLIALVAVGAAFWVYRMAVGLAASTNLTAQRPWGLWIAMDVGSGIALAGGGFVSCAIFHVFHRQRYHLLARSALVCALLGYTFYVPGLLADLGKWYQLPITMLPPMWQGNSVLFEVGMCVMIYLNVQYAELTPIVCERLLGEDWLRRFPRIRRLTQLLNNLMTALMPLFLCLGVCLSTFHQSSLGNLMNIAPYKLNHLWWGPVSPVLFFLSAAMVGLPMVIFTLLFASWCLHREPEMETLAPLARRYVPAFMALYLAVKIGDMVWRGTYPLLTDGSSDAVLWMIEVALLVVPFVMFLSPRLCRSPRSLAVACLLVILGVVLNRLNVLVLGFHPPFETKPYVPSVTEFMISLGLVAALMLVYRLAVTYLPILEPRPIKKAAIL